jgi:hypothetical protein
MIGIGSQQRLRPGFRAPQFPCVRRPDGGANVSKATMASYK